MQGPLLTLAALAAVVPAALAVPAPLNQQSGMGGSTSFLNAASQGQKPEFQVKGKNGAVVSPVDVCSNIGAELLQLGGSAADAIIGASLCVGSMDAFHSGIGGGGFGLIRRPNQTVEMFDFRETMPAAGNETLFKDNPDKNASLIGGLASGVPGEIRAWELLHAKYGKLKWEQLFQPSVKLNRDGFKPHDQLVRSALDLTKYPFLCQDAIWAESYCPGGKLIKRGDTVKRERLAKTLETIGAQGPKAFYEGPIAENTVKAIKARKGIMTLEDLKNYTVIEREPNSIKYPGDFTIYSGVAPCSGNAVLSTLKTYAQFTDDPEYNIKVQRLIEADKFAYGERTNYGDPAFVQGLSELQKKYISDEYAAEKKKKIHDNAIEEPEYYNPPEQAVLGDSGTAHLVAIDSTGLAITLTTTINTFWGSQVMTEDGIILNNEMDDFSTPGVTNFFGLKPTEANFIRPGKRPLSSISPVIVHDKDGNLVLATGSAGGSRIITAVIQVVWGVLSQNLNIADALGKGRWHHQLSPYVLNLEWADPTYPAYSGFPNATAEFLKRVGHNVTYVAPGSSSAQGIQVLKDKTLLTGSEARQLDARGSAF